MSITTTEIENLYNKFIQIYLERNAEQLLDLFDDNLSVISGGSDFIMDNKEFFYKELLKEHHEAPKINDIKTLKTNIQILDENNAILTTITFWEVPMLEEVLKSIGRLVFVFRKVNDKLKILHCSVSAPITNIQGEHFPVEEYEERARILQEKVDQKTKELMEKEEAERKLIEEKAELEVKRIENENAILRLEIDKVRMDLQLKENELVNYAMNLASKNDCFNMLEEKFNYIKGHTGKDLKIEMNQVLAAMRNNISIEKEWNNFQLKFNMINQNFINNLTAICPILSKSEIIICSMLRLQIDPKDIARFKYVSLSNIQNHILRIRKKLNLERKHSLMKFLIEL